MDASNLFIRLDGEIVGLSDDTLDKLGSLGPRTVKRVSEIEFNAEKGEWEAFTTTGEFIASHPIRSQVIRMEREWFNTRFASVV